MSLQVSQLVYYPVKSLGAISATDMPVTQWGPHRDRRLMLVDENGKFVTQRQLPEMTLCSVSDNGEALRFEMQQQSMTIPWPDFSGDGKVVEVSVWNDQVKAVEVSEASSAWFSKLFGRTLRLVMMPDQSMRQVDLDFAQAGDRTGFSDGFPFLLVSEASIKALEAQLAFDLDVLRFRPNIVVSGCEAFAEDQWKTISINGIEFDVVKPCSRCVIPTLNPTTAEKQPEVMKLMLKTRKQGNAVYVGQNLIHRGEGMIRVGDGIEVKA